MISERDDACLVQAVLSGDNEAYGELVRRYRNVALGIAHSRLGDYDAAMDVAQEALVTAYVQLPTLREPARFAAWLCRIANNIALVRLRRHRQTHSLDSQEFIGLQSDEADPADAVERSSERDLVREALARLSDQDRVSTVLHYVSGYSHEEIARMLGVSSSSVKSRLYRARRQLREEMIALMQEMGDRLPDVEMTREQFERILTRYDCGEHGVIMHMGGIPGALPGMPVYTQRSEDAVRLIADKLREEGCTWLYAPVHIPDGSPALPIFRNLGFETETQMLWYERDLSEKLPVVPPLPDGFALRPLRDADSRDIVTLLRATVQKHAPDAVSSQSVRETLNDRHVVVEASLAAYCDDTLVAVVSAFAVDSWEVWKYEPGAGVLGWVVWDETAAPESVIHHAVAVSLKVLKKRGLKVVVKDQLDPERDSSLISILDSLGFRYVRSQWNLKLRLQDIK